MVFDMLRDSKDADCGSIIFVIIITIDCDGWGPMNYNEGSRGATVIAAVNRAKNCRLSYRKESDFPHSEVAALTSLSLIFALDGND
jgi:hypothetical protein